MIQTYVRNLNLEIRSLRLIIHSDTKQYTFMLSLTNKHFKKNCYTPNRPANASV